MGYGATEIVADDHHVYRAESRVREYDDEPLNITKAVIWRRPHAGGETEILFDFQRDGMRCTPHALTLLPDGLGWLCYEEWGDGPFDPTAWVQLHPSGRSVAPFYTAAFEAVAADPSGVYAILSYHQLVRLDPRTGRQEPLGTLPDELGSVSKIWGLLPGRLVGVSTTATRDLVWSVSTDGSAGLRTEAFPRSAVHDVAVGGGRIAVSWGRYPEYQITLIEGERTRTLLQGGHLASHLLLAGDTLYFDMEDSLRSVDLKSGQATILALGKPQGRPAVGGGFLYWLQEGELRRIALPPR